ncbi:flagellar basal body P-ring formation chaperone FlgA [Zooshikella ganghwensis]|uniref:flagellar basal body P-ring formation chaperone FlgA n=1 Tax=Zooshikella ganghwensis TaxID=202772 RepID=UPI0003F5896C|nr:flagellar basal body P-ring formation chaperone FlgA [Zooshikella ganghwensis]
MNYTNSIGQFSLIRQYFALGLLLYLYSYTCLASPLNDQVQQAAHRYLLNKLQPLLAQSPSITYKIRINPLDQRLRLALCQAPLLVSQNRHSKSYGRITLAIDCPNIWQVYVTSEVSIFRQVLASRRTIPKKRQITDADLMWQTVDISRLRHGYFTEQAPVIGKIATKTITLGQVISRRHIDTATIITKGTKVAIIASAAHFAVRSFGIALSDGKPGERIKVRNNRSKRVVEGIVKDSNTVQVLF